MMNPAKGRRIALVLMLIPGMASTVTAATRVDHSLFSTLLERTVGPQGWVDYETIREHRNLLDEYLDSLKQTDPRKLTRNEQLAYWINLYNALTIRSVIDHWPVRSVLHDFPGNAFFEKWKHETALGKLTLNQIENDVIRRKFQDPRVHAALNCASRGCPPLVPRAFTGERLDAMLDAAVRRWINDPQRNRFDFKKKKAQLSPIFQWYADDFRAVGGPLAFAARYHQNPDKKIFRKMKVSFLDYDWSLNGR